MDCLYSFPLPASAAVYRCEMHVNGRVLRARVEEQGRAREIAREQKAAGRRTALVEMERENLFTFSLGNLQPGDGVVIRFGYFETLTRLADWTSLRIPFCPGVRYIPASRCCARCGAKAWWMPAHAHLAATLRGIHGKAGMTATSSVLKKPKLATSRAIWSLDTA